MEDVIEILKLLNTELIRDNTGSIVIKPMPLDYQAQIEINCDIEYVPIKEIKALQFEHAYISIMATDCQTTIIIFGK